MSQETESRKKDEELTGSDLPNADGKVSDEDVNAIDDDKSGKPTGQDRSTENYEETEPRDGVGAVQRRSDDESDVFHSK